ncbi:MAG: hypothetical protein HF307_19455 [Ignavibacteria bacterium]|jgi:hypothetical protein|nr:hypothetical protein [Ignavibacteria bacterium]
MRYELREIPEGEEVPLNAIFSHNVAWYAPMPEVRNEIPTPDYPAAIIVPVYKIPIPDRFETQPGFGRRRI